MSAARHFISTIRRLRLGAAALLIYQVFFLKIFLPGHTRGAITVDGKHTPACCCCCCPDRTVAADGSHKKDTPSQKDCENCAVCQFAARMSHGTTVQFTLPPLGLLAVVAPVAPTPVESILRLSTYDGRGPPTLV